MITSSPRTHRQEQSEQSEQIIYNYLLHSVQAESPELVLKNFGDLFIEGRGKQNYEVYKALNIIISSRAIDTEFDLFINRCCYIIINRWQMLPQTQTYIPKLVELFTGLLPTRIAASPSLIKLRQLVINFTKTDYYLKLERLSRVIASKGTHTYIGSLINRYPYLYDHYLLDNNSTEEQQKIVRKIKSTIQHRFELDLSKYITQKVRLAQIARKPELGRESSKIIQTLENPTLLSDKELGKVLKHFVGTVESGYTYRDLSDRFNMCKNQVSTYKNYKDQLYQYLISSVDPKYGQHKFNDKLYEKIDRILPEYNHRPPDDFLVLRTSTQLLNYLVVDSSQNPEHYVFLDLITNLGPTTTTGLLLKLVLSCHKVKPYLEKRFSILFSHYDTFTKERVPWLVKSLENINIAFSVNFGKADFSFLRQIW